MWCWQGSGEIWSAAHSFGSKGASFAFSETNLAFSDAGAKADKNFMENGCLMLSGYFMRYFNWLKLNFINLYKTFSSYTTNITMYPQIPQFLQYDLLM